KIEVAGHYGYPGFLVHAFDDRVNLTYWDYQLRLDWKGLTVEAIGSFDEITLGRDVTMMGVTKRVNDPFRLDFYRVQVRDREKFGRADFEVGLVGGVDELASFSGA